MASFADLWRPGGTFTVASDQSNFTPFLTGYKTPFCDIAWSGECVCYWKGQGVQDYWEALGDCMNTGGTLLHYNDLTVYTSVESMLNDS